MLLYKYLEPEWIDALTTTGGIRIGTLFDFRRKEHGEVRADPHEGMQLVQTDGEARTYTYDELPPFLQNLYPAGGRGRDTVRMQFAQGAVVRSEASAPDVYVYCMATRFDRALMAKFGGACARINDAEAFFRSLSADLYARFDRNGVRCAVSHMAGACHYRERLETWPHVTNYHPVFTKPLDQSYQYEFRCFWAAPATIIRPFNTTIAGVARYCERIA